MTSLSEDAQHEAVRIRRARALVRTEDQALVSAALPSISSARRWRTRASLGSHSLMLWQVVADDGRFATIGSTLVAVAVDDWHRYDDPELLQCIARSIEPWQSHVLARHQTFLKVRLQRERAFGRYSRINEIFQPGLFDRRHERARLALAAARDESDGDRSRRIVMLEQALDVSFQAPQLLLVLTP